MDKLLKLLGYKDKSGKLLWNILENEFIVAEGFPTAAAARRYAKKMLGATKVRDYYE